MLSSMIGKKKVSDASEPTQPQRSRRFFRRNSFHTLNCRSGSLKKFNYNSSQLIPSASNVPPAQETHKTHKKAILKTQIQTFFKDFSSPFDNSLKRCSGSMKIDSSNLQKKCQMQKLQSLKRQLSIREQQIDLLEGQCKKLKMLVNEQRQKRKTLQQQMRCNKLQLKRMQKRVEKYTIQKQKYEQERTTIIAHIEELEAAKFKEDVQNIHSLKLKVVEGEVAVLRGQLQKNRSERERQLMVEVQRMMAGKFKVDSQLKSSLISNDILTKQLQQTNQEMQQVQQSIHKAVISSYEYIQLRERYRKMLVEYKQLRQEMSMLQQANYNKTIQNTILTVSDNSEGLYLQ